MASISGLYTALLVMLALLLTGYVITGRNSEKVWLGDGNNSELTKRIRAHANLIETAPLFLIMLVLMELNGAGPVWLHLLGAAFLIARIVHAIGLLRFFPNLPLRVAGMAVTLTVMGISALYLLVQSLAL